MNEDRPASEGRDARPAKTWNNIFDGKGSQATGGTAGQWNNRVMPSDGVTLPTNPVTINDMPSIASIAPTGKKLNFVGSPRYLFIKVKVSSGTDCNCPTPRSKEVYFYQKLTLREIAPGVADLDRENSDAKEVSPENVGQGFGNEIHNGWPK